VVESRVEFGYTVTGAKVGTNPVSFTYPWPDLLVLAVKDSDRKSEKPLIVAGGSGVTLDWKEGAAAVSLHWAVKVSGQTVTCTPDLASLGDIDQAAGAVFTARQAAATDPMAPTIDLLKRQIADKQSQLDLAVRMVSTTSTDAYVTSTYTTRVTQYQKELEALNARLADAMRTSSSSGVKTSAQVAEKEKALQALLEAHAKAVASHGPVQVLDPWGVPVATCNLDFQMCDVDVLINQRGKTTPHTAVTPTARPVPTPTARPVPTRTTGGRPVLGGGVGASPSTSSGSLFTPGPSPKSPAKGGSPSGTLFGSATPVSPAPTPSVAAAISPPAPVPSPSAPPASTPTALANKAAVQKLMEESQRLEKQEDIKAALDKLEEIKTYDKKYWPPDLNSRVTRLRDKLQALLFFGVAPAAPTPTATRTTGGSSF